MIYLFIVIGMLLRLAPHPDNVTPIMAIALFAGVYMKGRAVWLFPIATLFLSDLGIGLYSFPIMASVYLSFIGGAYFGKWIGRKKKITRVLGGTLASTMFFFVVTNFAVWLFAGHYPQTLAGLTSCYLSAIPFLRNSLLGNIGYVGIFFVAYELFGHKVDLRLESLWRKYQLGRAV